MTRLALMRSLRTPAWNMGLVMKSSMPTKLARFLTFLELLEVSMLMYGLMVFIPTSLQASFKYVFMASVV